MRERGGEGKRMYGRKEGRKIEHRGKKERKKEREERKFFTV
jgi:hypothetical protein